MSYLTTNQYKLDKSQGRGWKTVGLNLSPDIEARLILQDEKMPTMCAKSGTCADVCLVKTGMNKFSKHATVRALKTKEWVTKPVDFVNKVTAEIKQAERAAARKKMRLAVRPNLLSDQPKLAHALAKANPNVQFYDYTKLPWPRKRVLDNYHLTYSVSEKTTREDLTHCLNYGINLAVVTNVKRGQPLPKTMRVMGKRMRVVDGDQDDLRFLDSEGIIVALRWKGSNADLATGLNGGFVVDVKKELVR